jgi:hypothetical protein
MYTGKKSTNEKKEKPEQKFDAAFGEFLELVFSKKQAKTSYYGTFSLELGRL